MNSTPLLYLLMGLLFGTTLLALGIALGFWMGKRTGGAGSPLAGQLVADQQQMLSVIRNMATWTSDFAGDFTRYQSTLDSLTKAASDGKTVRTKEEVQKLLDQIVNANNQLQSRLDNAEERLEQQTKQLAGYLTEARTDGLTGLANRRAFDQKMDECFTTWHKSKQPFSLALIDIDHFKRINDTFGHPAGDAVLRELAVRMRDLEGEATLVARYGGEEFGVIFGGGALEAAAIMDRLRLSIAEHPFTAEGVPIPVTISGGVAQVAGDERIGKFVRRSDEALYSAKMGGRNRIFVHNGILCESFGNPAVAGSASGASGGSGEQPPTTNDLEHRILSRLDHLVSQEANRKD